MIKRILSAAIYLTTVLCVGNYCEMIDGMEPPRLPPSALQVNLWHVAIAGALMFAIACIVSIFSHRLGIFCGLGACLMSWPHFGALLVTFPVRQLMTLLPFPWVSDLWPGIIGALAMLLISTVYTLIKLRALGKDSRRASDRT
jgi:hypothetical protein